MEKRSLFRNVFIRNLLGLILVTVLLAVGVLFWLNFYTQHGKAVVVPDVKGLSVDKADPFFVRNHLNYSVVDSVFSKNATPGTIAETTPKVGSKVKEGRTVYLKINAYLPQLITLPDIKDSSQRQALAMLNSLGFENIEIKMVPGVYEGLVVGLENKGVSVEAGQRVPLNASLSLLVSSGSDDIILLGDSLMMDSSEVSSEESWF